MDIEKILQKQDFVVFTFVASDALEASKARFSNVRSNRRPSPFANILIPLSLAETANRVPSLLKRMRGLAFQFVNRIKA